MRKQVITIEREVDEFVGDNATETEFARLASEHADPMRVTNPRVSVVSEPIPEAIVLKVTYTPPHHPAVPLRILDDVRERLSSDERFPFGSFHVEVIPQ